MEREATLQRPPPAPGLLPILRLVEVGKSNTAIALALGYSVSTIKQELQRVMRNMGVSDRADAAARARNLGLLTDSVS